MSTVCGAERLLFAVDGDSAEPEEGVPVWQRGSCSAASASHPDDRAESLTSPVVETELDSSSQPCPTYCDKRPRRRPAKSITCRKSLSSGALNNDLRHVIDFLRAWAGFDLLIVRTAQEVIGADEPRPGWDPCPSPESETRRRRKATMTPKATNRAKYRARSARSRPRGWRSASPGPRGRRSASPGPRGRRSASPGPRGRRSASPGLTRPAVGPAGTRAGGSRPCRDPCGQSALPGPRGWQSASPEPTRAAVGLAGTARAGVGLPELSGASRSPARSDRQPSPMLRPLPVADAGGSAVGSRRSRA
ncbi:hypothetical protein J2S43_003175 [Catenuloplanes nepalensis]|uniref:Uncharacterized protein n=1 Tax=Catenuloplanes nepalensis TaxID=587533 RepID=A0ABT9MTB1_9ACTN|nr:hypothetical protein [Catenuloplanes nepalensis]